MNKEDIKNQENNDLIRIADQNGVETAIERLINKNASLLPKDVATQRIVNSAGFYISHRKDLMDLGRDGKLDMLYGVLKEAMVGCEAGTDFDIIPFKGKPVISRKKEGWYKIIDLIKPAEIIRFTNNVIFRGDEYSFNPVTEELTHIPKVTSDRYDDIVGAYAYIKFANGFEKTIFMTKKDLDAIKRVSPSANSTYSPWVSMPVKMVKTKVVKELAKELNILFGGRVNHALSQAVESDEISVKEVDVNGNIENDKGIYDTNSDEKESEKEPEQEQPKENKVSENSQVEITLDDVK
jgi:phage RecT family recombinase